MEEKELLQRANAWFAIEYGDVPEKLGMDYVKLWNKTFFWKKVPTVVFAPNEKIGEAFIKTQKVILHHMSWFWLYAFLDILVMITIVVCGGLSPESIAEAAVFGFSLSLFYVGMGIWAQRNEKIYKDNVTWYAQAE